MHRALPSAARQRPRRSGKDRPRVRQLPGTSLVILLALLAIGLPAPPASGQDDDAQAYARVSPDGRDRTRTG